MVDHATFDVVMVSHSFAPSARLVVLAVVLSVTGARGQMHSDPVHTDGRPLADVSANVGAGSRPVYENGRSVSESSLGRLSGNSVRGSVSGDVHSGPVSDVSAGPVTSWQPVSGGGTMTDASAGSVHSEMRAEMAAQALEPVRDLGPLVEQLRAIQPVPDSGPLPEAESEAQPQDEIEEAAPDEQDAPDVAAPADDQEAAPSEAEAREAAGAAPGEEPPNVAPDASGVPAVVVDDPRDAAEPTPRPAGR